jgi:cellulose synthase/poly-beta-1,6-N-acetylglucosamine synthase-like glycosyltransferase
MISVIVPMRDEEEHLERCLRALSKQSIPREEYEILAVDDGSRDQSAAVARAAGALVISQQPSGPSASRNNGVRHARGEVVVLFDADCLAPANWIEELTRPIVTGSADVTVGRYETDQKSAIARLIQLELNQRYRRMSRRPETDFVNSGASAFRRQILLDHPFDESYRTAGIEDVDLSFRLAQQRFRMLFLPELAVRHSHPTRLRDLLKRKFIYASRAWALYRKYPRKLLRDASTPQKRRLQVVFLGLAVVCAPFSLLLTAVCMVAWGILSLPFIAAAFRESISLGLVAPGFVLAVTAAFVLGSLWGAVSSLAAARSRDSHRDEQA